MYLLCYVKSTLLCSVLNANFFAEVYCFRLNLCYGTNTVDWKGGVFFSNVSNYSCALN